MTTLRQQSRNATTSTAIWRKAVGWRCPVYPDATFESFPRLLRLVSVRVARCGLPVNSEHDAAIPCALMWIKAR